MQKLVGYGGGEEVANIPSDIGENKNVRILCCPPIENGGEKSREFEILRVLSL